MSGRNGKPVDLLLLEGKKHLTQEEIEARKNQEAGMKSGADYKPNAKVRANPVALKMFRKLKVYAGSEHPHAAQQPVAWVPSVQEA
jgi:ribosomal protein L13